MTDYDCAMHCAKCIVTDGCWADAANLGDAGDMKCAGTCYKSCDTVLGATSKFCDCSHGKCVTGCLDNCEMKKICTDNCRSNFTGGCDSLCTHCAEEYQCWKEHTNFTGPAPYNCGNLCYSECKAKLGSDSILCSCAKHELCTLDCPDNCDAAVVDKT